MRRWIPATTPSRSGSRSCGPARCAGTRRPTKFPPLPNRRLGAARRARKKSFDYSVLLGAGRAAGGLPASAISESMRLKMLALNSPDGNAAPSDWRELARAGRLVDAVAACVAEHDPVTLAALQQRFA